MSWTDLPAGCWGTCGVYENRDIYAPYDYCSTIQLISSYLFMYVCTYECVASSYE